MATECLTSQLQTFLQDPTRERVVVVFPTLQIQTFRHGEHLHNLYLAQKRLRFLKTKTANVVRIQVLDNLVFRFSFVFSTRTLQSQNKVCAKKLPRPMDKGWIWIQINSVQLVFWNDGPDPNLRVYEEQRYL